MTAYNGVADQQPAHQHTHDKPRTPSPTLGHVRWCCMVGSLVYTWQPRVRGFFVLYFTDDESPVCPICGCEMDERHCKLICEGCGYRIDCSEREMEEYDD